MMKPCAESVSERQDKQLRKISLPAVLEKRLLDQALNAKEFAVCAGVSYSTARNWFCLPGFPSFGGVVFGKILSGGTRDKTGGSLVP